MKGVIETIFASFGFLALRRVTSFEGGSPLERVEQRATVLVRVSGLGLGRASPNRRNHAEGAARKITHNKITHNARRQVFPGHGKRG